MRESTAVLIILAMVAILAMAMAGSPAAWAQDPLPLPQGEVPLAKDPAPEVGLARCQVWPDELLDALNNLEPHPETRSLTGHELHLIRWLDSLWGMADSYRDGWINEHDLAYMFVVFGSRVNVPGYLWWLDLSRDGRIDMIDMSMVTVRYQCMVFLDCYWLDWDGNGIITSSDMEAREAWQIYLEQPGYIQRAIWHGWAPPEWVMR